MKYLSKREDFLKEYKINEAFDMSGSGPMGNDINWGDSLVGRLINSIRRKIGIGSSLVRINSCIKALRNTFDEIIDGSSVNQLDETQKKNLGSVFIYEIVRIIEIAIYDKKQLGFTGESDEEGISTIDNKDYLSEIESMIIDGIQEIGSIEDEYKVENADNIIRYLNELLEKVKEMRKDLKESNSKKEEVKDDEFKNTEVKSNNDEIEKKANLIFVENFRSIANIYNTYKSLKEKQNKQKEKTENDNNKSSHKLEFGGTEQNKNVNQKSTSKESISESLLLENKNSVLLSIKSLYNVINSDGGDEALIDIKNILQSQRGQVIQLNTMNKLYKNVRRKLGIVDKTNEKLEVLLSKESLSDAIVNLYKNTKSANLNELGSLSKDISIFNQTMEKCLDINLFSSIKESKILMDYNSFIKENDQIKTDDTKEQTNLEDKKERITLENQQSILKEHWRELLSKGLGKYILTTKEVQKLKIEFEKFEETKSESLIINGGSSGIDPIISIVKIFNRAYKLHTVPVIPGGRSGGKVSNQTFREYTSFGGGNPTNAGESGGPYRNNKVFNKWESAVLDIMRDRKYQPIFNKETALFVGGKKKKGVGTALNRFINDLLDGDTLYQSGSKGYGESSGGAQKKFLLKYFGDIVGEGVGKIEELTNNDLSVTGSNDAERNQKLADNIKTVTISISDEKPSSENTGTIFMVKEEKSTVYFHISFIGENFTTVFYTRSLDKIKNLIEYNYSGKSISFETKLDNEEKSPLFISRFRKGVIEEISNGTLIKLKGNRVEEGIQRDHNPSEIIEIKNNKTGLGWFINKEEKENIKIEKYNKNWLKNYTDKTAITEKR